METNRTSKWKEKREQIAKENEVHNYLTNNQRDLIALELTKMFIQERYSDVPYQEYLKCYIIAFNNFREDIERKDKELNAN